VLLDRPEAPPPGWFLGVEINVLGVHIKDRLQARVPINGANDLVHLGSADLDWTGSPRIELGYRLPEGLGEFLLSYRYLETEGGDTALGFDVDGSDALRKSRLDMNVVDIDYGSREYSLGPRWGMKWKAGVRLATIYFDSLTEGVLREERTSNNFYGGGPHVGLDLWRTFERMPALALFTRLEGATVIGQIHQAFEEVVINPDDSVSGGAAVVHHTEAVPVLTVQAGLGYTRGGPGHWRRFSVGYEFEAWWYVGQAGDSRADITTQGFFFRGEFGY
jgi:hypothetical protein